MADLQLTGDVAIDFSKLNAQVAQARAAAEPLRKSLEDVQKASAVATREANNVAASVKRMGDSAKQATQSTQSLVQTTQQMTQRLLGANVASIALGAAIGGVLMGAVTAVVRAVVEAVAQFQQLQNELAAIPSVGAQAASVMTQLEQAIVGSNTSLRDMAQEFASLQPILNAVGFALEEQVRIVTDYSRAVNAVRPQTIGGATQGLLTEIGGVIAGLDRLTGISNIVITILNGISAAFRFIRNILPGGGAVETVTELQQSYDALNARIVRMTANLGNLGRQQRAFAEREIEMQRIQLRQLEEQILLRREAERTAELPPKATALIRELANETTHLVSIMRLSNVEQEIRNRQYQFEIQLLQAGVPLARARAEAEQAGAQIRQQVLAQQFQGLRDSLMTQEALEMQSFQRRTEVLTGFLQQGLIQRQEFDALYEAEFHRSQTAMLQIQLANQSLLLNAQMAAGQAGVNVLQILGQKSKVFAVASIALNTALSVARAIQNTSVAATRALAELGPIAGPPAAAGIKAWGALEVASIIAAGTLQGVGVLSGSGGPSVGGGGSGGGTATPATDNDGRAPLRIEIEQVDPRAIFTGEQLNGLIDAINNQAENGRVVIASKLV